MKEYKILSLDLDGTLLMPDLTIPEIVCKKLCKLQEKGIIITLSTGRMFPTAERYANEIGLKSPLITYNGGVLRCPGEKAIYKAEISEEIQKEIIKCCEERNWYIQSYDNDRIIVKEYDEHTKGDLDTLENEVIEIGEMSKAKLSPTPKMTSKCLHNDMEEKLRVLRERFSDKVSIYTSGEDVIEIMPHGVSKLSTLKKLCEVSGCTLDDVVSCGDSGNDIDTVKAAGLGCAMANSIEELKNIADYVCKESFSYGVLEVIERFFDE